MNISEVIDTIKKHGDVPNIFRDGLIFNLKCADYKTAGVFYGYASRSDDIYGFSNQDTADFRDFSVQYTCYVLSGFPKRGMSATVKNCSLNEMKNKMFSKDNDGYTRQGLFKNIAVDSLYRLGIKEFARDAGTMESILKNPGFFISHVKDSVPQLQALIFLLNEVDAQAVDRVLGVWMTLQSEVNVDWKLFLTYNWIDSFIEELAQGNSIYSNLYNDINAACEKERTETKTISGGSYAGGYPVTYKEERTYHYYGEAVGAWLKETANQYGYYSGKEPAYQGTDAPSSGCVKEGTKLLMADGTQKNIEEMQYRDEIRNCRGDISFVSIEMVKNSSVKFLYAVNEDEPFMSPEHPILTGRGWCSLNPKLSMEINPAFQVQLLEKGDVFKKAVWKDGALTYEEIVVEKINVKENQAGTMCYDLDFYDGYKSYYANGYPCLCNYPHITVQTITDGLHRLTESEKEAAIKMFTENAVILEKLIGRVAWKELSGNMGGLYDEMESENAL